MPIPPTGPVRQRRQRRLVDPAGSVHAPAFHGLCNITLVRRGVDGVGYLNFGDGTLEEEAACYFSLRPA